MVGIGYYIAISDQPKARQWVTNWVESKLETNVEFSKYTFSKTHDFPWITLTLHDILIEGIHFKEYEKELLRCDKLNFAFHPWQWVWGKYELKELRFENTKIKFFKDTTGLSNIKVLAPLLFNKQGQKKGGLSLNNARFENLYFEFIDTQRQKKYQVDVPSATLDLQNENANQLIQFDADCYFHQLLFDHTKGPFLKNTNGTVSLRVSIDSTKNNIQLLPSTLLVGDDIINLQGQFAKADTNFLALDISSEGILLENAVPILSTDIQTALKGVEVDQPIQTAFQLNGPLVPGEKVAFELEFSTQNALFKFQDKFIKDLSVRGHYTNNDNANDKTSKETNVFTIHELAGKFMGTINTRLNARLKNFVDLSEFEIDTEINGPLKNLQTYIPYAQLFDIQKGLAFVDIKYKGSLRDVLNQKPKKENTEMSGTIKIIDGRFGENNFFGLDWLSGDFQFNEDRLHIHQMDIRYDDTDYQFAGLITNHLPFISGDGKLNTDFQLKLDSLNVNEYLEQYMYGETNRQVENTLKVKKITNLVRSINPFFNIRFSLFTNYFKYDSLSLENVQIETALKDSVLNQKTKVPEPVVLFSIQTTSESKIHNLDASIMLFELDDPFVFVNAAVSAPIKQLKYIRFFDEWNFDKGMVDIHTNTSFRLNHFIQKDSLLNSLQTNGKIFLENIYASSDRNKLQLQGLGGMLHFDEEKISIANLKLNYESQQFEISGDINNHLPYLLGMKQPFKIDLSIDVPEINLYPTQSGETSMTQEWGSPKDWLDKLVGYSNMTTGKIRANIGNIRHVYYPLQQVTFIAYLNEDCKNYKTGIDCFEVDSLSAILWDSTAVHANFELNDFADPQLRANVAIDLPVASMRNMFPPHQLAFFEGMMDIDVVYHGEMYHDLSRENYLLENSIDGKIMLKNGAIDYVPRGYEFRNLNGVFEFDEKNLLIKHLETALNQNWVTANGRSENFMPFLILPEPEEKITIELETHSPYFNFYEFSTPRLLALKQKLKLETRPKFTVAKLDELLNKGTLDLSVKADTMVYRTFQPENVEGSVLLGANKVELNGVKMEVADGTLAIDGRIDNIVNHAPRVDVHVVLKDNNVQRIFEAFENFGQRDLTSQKIKGVVSANILFRTDVNDNYRLLPSSFLGQMNIKIYDAELIDILTMNDLGSFLFKKRKFDNIAIDTLKTKTFLRGKHLFVDNFYIHASPIDFSVSGLYSLGSDDASNLFFKIPIGNLFRKHVGKEDLSNPKTRRKGFNINIEAIEKKDNLDFKFRLFGNKKRKKKRRRKFLELEH